MYQIDFVFIESMINLIKMLTLSLQKITNYVKCERIWKMSKYEWNMGK